MASQQSSSSSKDGIVITTESDEISHSYAHSLEKHKLAYETLLKAQKAFYDSRTELISHPRYEIESPVSWSRRMYRLVEGLAMVWSNGKSKTWPLVQTVFEKHLTSFPREYKEHQIQENGLFVQMSFVYWQWDSKPMMWAVDHEESGFVAEDKDLHTSPPPSFQNSREYPETCDFSRWFEEKSIDPQSAHLKYLERLNLLQISKADETDETNINVIITNICNAIANISYKSYIETLEQAEEVMALIPESYWPLFLCWVGKVYTS